MTAGPACSISSSAPSPSSCTPSALRSTSSRTTSTSRRGSPACTRTSYAVGVILGGLAAPRYIRRVGGSRPALWWGLGGPVPVGRLVLRVPGSAVTLPAAAICGVFGCLPLSSCRRRWRAPRAPRPARRPSPRRTRSRPSWASRRRSRSAARTPRGSVAHGAAGVAPLSACCTWCSGGCASRWCAHRPEPVVVGEAVEARARDGRYGGCGGRRGGRPARPGRWPSTPPRPARPKSTCARPAAAGAGPGRTRAGALLPSPADRDRAPAPATSTSTSTSTSAADTGASPTASHSSPGPPPPSATSPAASGSTSSRASAPAPSSSVSPCGAPPCSATARTCPRARGDRRHRGRRGHRRGPGGRRAAGPADADRPADPRGVRHQPGGLRALLDNRHPFLMFGGLAVAGLGVSLQYPLLSARGIELSGGQAELAGAVNMFGTGISVGTAPFALGFLSDHVGIHTAYLLLPGFIVAAMVAVVCRDSGARRRAPFRHDVLPRSGAVRLPAGHRPRRRGSPHRRLARTGPRLPGRRRPIPTRSSGRTSSPSPPTTPPPRLAASTAAASGTSSRPTSSTAPSTAPRPVPRQRRDPRRRPRRPLAQRPHARRPLHPRPRLPAAGGVHEAVDRDADHSGI